MLFFSYAASVVAVVVAKSIARDRDEVDGDGFEGEVGGLGDDGHEGFAFCDFLEGVCVCVYTKGWAQVIERFVQTLVFVAIRRWMRGDGAMEW